MSCVGVDHLRVRLTPPALWKDQVGVEIDLSSIAPGYAVDLLIEQLKDLGFANVMVEIGGEVRGVGRRADGAPWRIGVERASQPDAEFVRIVALDNLALTTAGDYRIFRGDAKSRYTHIIDPTTGQALPYRGVSVTVLAETCMDADALDTALLVMGAERGYQWCVKHRVAALFQAGDDGQRVRTTPRFDQLVGEQAALEK
jgi:thiamine biosynthesis lipoprotein